MLLVRILLAYSRSQVIISTQCLRSFIKLYSSSSKSSDSSDSSNSSDSSDSSDSDTETEKRKRTVQNESKAEVKVESLNNLVNDLIKKKKAGETRGKQVNVAVSAQILTKKKNIWQTDIPYDVKLSKAAENVAQYLGKDFAHAKSELLRVLTKRHDITKNKPKQHEQKSKDSVMRQLLSYAEVKKKDEQPPPPQWKSKGSVTYQLTQLSNKEQSDKNKSIKITPLFGQMSTGIFRNMKKSSVETPKLTTWKALEQRELDLLLHQPPQNIFQEMIQWTKEGKLWKFPIDNEIGLEEEHGVHFSEHVFLERHLKDWCPKRGPVRHFMELVCVGLSKNPYMTVNEKLEHIKWYKEYFKDKEDLLKEVGAIDASLSSKPHVTEN